MAAVFFWLTAAASTRFRSSGEKPRRDDGRYEYRLRRPTHSGASSLLLTVGQLVKRLATLLPPPRPKRPRIDWATLLRHCGGRRRLLAAVTSPSIAEKVLRDIGPPPPQLSLPL